MQAKAASLRKTIVSSRVPFYAAALGSTESTSWWPVSSSPSSSSSLITSTQVFARRLLCAGLCMKVDLPNEGRCRMLGAFLCDSYQRVPAPECEEASDSKTGRNPKPHTQRSPAVPGKGKDHHDATGGPAGLPADQIS